MFGGFAGFNLPDLNDTFSKLQEDVKHNLENVSIGDTSSLAEGFKTLTDTFGGTLHALGGEATTSMQNDGVEEGVGDDDGAVAADAQASSSPTASDVSSQELQLEAAQHDDGDGHADAAHASTTAASDSAALDGDVDDRPSPSSPSLPVVDSSDAAIAHDKPPDGGFGPSIAVENVVDDGAGVEGVASAWTASVADDEAIDSPVHDDDTAHSVVPHTAAVDDADIHEEQPHATEEQPQATEEDDASLQESTHVDGMDGDGGEGEEEEGEEEEEGDQEEDVQTKELLQAAAAVVARPPPPVAKSIPPLEDLGSMDTQALQQLATVLQESLEAKQAQLLHHVDELASTKQVVKQLAEKNQQLARRTAKLSEDDFEQLRGEFEERLAAAERKCYALTKERDALRRGTEKLSSANELLKAKDEMIKELMEEGEKLSIKQLDQETTIKKLRQQIEQMGKERARLVGVSSEQSTKLEGLRGEKAMLEAQIQSMLEHHRQQLDNERRRVAAELSAARRAQSEAETLAANNARQGAAAQLREAQAQLTTAEQTIVELQGALEQNRRLANQREDLLKSEIASLEERCQEAQLRHEELAAKLPETTGPLVRQLEALQSAAAGQAAAWQHTERTLMGRALEAEAKAAAAGQRERVLQERVLAAEASAAAAQGALDAAQQEIATLTTRTNTDATALTQALAHAQELEVTLASVRSEQEQLLSDKVQVIRMLEQQTESLQGHNAGLVTKVRDLEDKVTTMSLRAGSLGLGGPAPPSLAGPGYKWVLLHESNAAAAQHKTGSAGINGVDASSTSPVNGTTSPTTPIGDAAPTTQMAQLRQQVAGLEATRSRLSTELLQASSVLETASAAQAEVLRLRQELTDVHAQHAACIELLGEKQEALEEARADLEDVKGMLKQQVLLFAEHLHKVGLSTDGLMGVETHK